MNAAIREDSRTQSPARVGTEPQPWWLSRPAGALVSLFFLVCLVSGYPVAEVGLVDDWSYVFSAYKLADTGHIVYNGWATAILGWQLYVGAAMVRLFGHSFTAVRAGTFLTATLTVYLFHRTFVRAGLRGQFAVFGALTIALSPVFISLAPTYMSDIYGCFAITICLYGCVRALTATADRLRIQWLLFAIGTNVVFGSARQIAWFGVILLVPGTLVALRTRTTVLKTAIPALIVAGLCILAMMGWYHRQPYSLPEPILPHNFGRLHVTLELIAFLSDIPFMLLPLTACFAVVLFLRQRRMAGYALLAALVYTLLAAIFQGKLHLLEPTGNDSEILFGVLEGTVLLSNPQPILADWVRYVLTVISVDGLLSLVYLTYVSASRENDSDEASRALIPRHYLFLMTVPYLAGYVAILLSRATWTLWHRYALGLAPVLVLVGLWVVQRLHQRKIPALAWATLAVTGLWGIAVIHDQFSLSRARINLMKAYLSTGQPRSAISGGWEDDNMFELTQAPAVNDSRIENPPGFYKAFPNRTLCGMHDLGCGLVPGMMALHVHALYGVAYYPVPGVPEAPFGHVTYSRWLTRKPGVLYVVRLPGANDVQAH